MSQTITIPVSPLLEVSVVLGTLDRHAIPGVEEPAVEKHAVEKHAVENHHAPAAQHRRAVETSHGWIAIALRVEAERIRVTVECCDHPDHAPACSEIGQEARAIVRRWFDLDRDLHEVNHQLMRDAALAPLVTARPGLRVTQYPAGFEALIMTILGQQVSVAAGTTFGGRIVAAYGEDGPGGLRLFPRPEALAAARPEDVQQAVKITHARARSVVAVAAAVANGVDVSHAADPGEFRERLLALPGIGPWTVEYLAARVLGDGDAYPHGDLVLRRALGSTGSYVTPEDHDRGEIKPRIITPAEAKRAGEAWRPFRAYALFHLWASES